MTLSFHCRRRAVVSSAAEPLERRDHVVEGAERIERRRRAVVQVVELRRGLARVRRKRHVAQRRLGPCHEVVALGGGLAGVPFLLETRQIALGRWMFGGKKVLHGRPAAVRRGHRLEARARLGKRGFGLGQQLGNRRGHPVAASEQQRQQRFGRRLAARTDIGQALGRAAAEPRTLRPGGCDVGHAQPRRKRLERLPRLRRHARPAIAVDARRPAVGNFGAHPGRQCLAEEPRRRVAVLAGLQLPVERRRHHRLLRLREKGRNGRETRFGVGQAFGQRREVARHQTQHAEDRLAGPQRGIPVHDVAALVFGQRDLGRGVGKRKVDLTGKGGDGVVGHPAGRVELRAERAQFVHLRREGRRRPVGQPIVVRMQAGERRGDRTLPVEHLEEPVERRLRPGGRPAYASGSVTHRRSRNESSTALIVSCTHAPSSKLPSLVSSSARISPMKLLTRLA